MIFSLHQSVNCTINSADLLLEQSRKTTQLRLNRSSHRRLVSNDFLSKELASSSSPLPTAKLGTHKMMERHNFPLLQTPSPLEWEGQKQTLAAVPETALPKVERASSWHKGPDNEKLPIEYCREAKNNVTTGETNSITFNQRNVQGDGNELIQPNRVKHYAANPAFVDRQGIDSRSNVIDQRKRTFDAVASTTDNRELQISGGGFHSDNAEWLLHRACWLYPTNIEMVSTANQLDPHGISKRKVCNSGGKMTSTPPTSRKSQKQERTPPHKKVRRTSCTCYPTSVGKYQQRQQGDGCCSPVGYPINIAIQNGASFEVLKYLAETCPGVIQQPDGADQSSSLGLALNAALSPKKNSASATTTTTTTQQDETPVIIDTVMKMLLLVAVNPQTACVPDRWGNFPLHKVVRMGLSSESSPEQSKMQEALLDLVSSIHQAYPTALFHRNDNGQTPLDVAMENPLCPDVVRDRLRTWFHAKLSSEG